MVAQLELIDSVSQFIYYIFSSLMLFWALSKCFWDGKKNRIVLFILTILANSMLGLVFDYEEMGNVFPYQYFPIYARRTFLSCAYPPHGMALRKMVARKEL